MSKLETITIDTPSGSNTMQIGSTNTATINLGVSGDTINVPAGVTIANAGTATGFGVAGTNVFSVKMSGAYSTGADNTNTKVPFNDEIFDADGVFDTSNYRFTAPAAGKYVISSSVNFWPNVTNAFQIRSMIYKNGSEITHFRGGLLEVPSGQNDIANSKFLNSYILNLAQSDYIEIYVRCRMGSGTFTIDQDSVLQGYRLT